MGGLSVCVVGGLSVCVVGVLGVVLSVYSTPSSVDSEKSARKKTPSNDSCSMERQDTA